MFASLVIAIFALVVPGSFKKMGLQLILDDKKWGFYFVYFSKIMFWTCIIFIATIWFDPNISPYLWIALPVIVPLRMYMSTKGLRFRKFTH